jgi:hypothetical protein
MGGWSPLNVPVYGPDRTRLQSPEYAGTGQALTQDAKGAGRHALRHGEEETMRVRPEDEPGGRSLPMEEIPEKYREAVKRYFSVSP